MKRELILVPAVNETLKTLSEDPAAKGLLKQVRKTLGFMETDLLHPSLNTHPFGSLTGPHGEKVFECYAQNETPGAYRVFFYYGPDRMDGKRRIPTLTVFLIAPHP